MFIGKYNKSVILTYLGVAFAVAGTALSFTGHAKIAVICLIAAGVCDLFDGTVARRCKRTDEEKRFGIQIDSLCDVVDFLILPVAICLGSGSTSIWQIACFVIYVIAGITRLGYFDIIADSEAPVKHYSGLPVTASAFIFPAVWLICSQFFAAATAIVMPICLALTAFFFVLNIKIPKPRKVGSAVLAGFGAVVLTAICLVK